MCAYADEAYAIGPSAPRESYLRIDRIIDAARQSGADAVHPGYGFLAENEQFAAAVRDAGLTFIGPTPQAIALMGSKTAARIAAKRAGVPIVPGTEDPLSPRSATRTSRASRAASAIPLLVKAVAGGGGKGMRTVEEPAELANAVRAARSEAGVGLRRRGCISRAAAHTTASHRGAAPRGYTRHRRSFRRTRVLDSAPPSEGRRGNAVGRGDAGSARRHDRGSGSGGEGRRVHQRGHDRISARRERRLLLSRDEHAAAGRASDHRDGHGPRSGSLADPDRAGRTTRRSIPQRALQPNGHAIECRIYAEDPDNGFLPSPGRILALRAPSGPGVRDDSGATAGLDVPIFYDPMISKLIAWAEDRPLAIARMRRALAEYLVVGIKTTLPFFTWLMGEPDFSEGRFHTTFLDALLKDRNGRPFVEPTVRLKTSPRRAAAVQSAMRPSAWTALPSAPGSGKRVLAKRGCAEWNTTIEIAGRKRQDGHHRNGIRADGVDRR